MSDAESGKCILAPSKRLRNELAPLGRSSACTETNEREFGGSVNLSNTRTQSTFPKYRTYSCLYQCGRRFRRRFSSFIASSLVGFVNTKSLPTRNNPFPVSSDKFLLSSCSRSAPMIGCGTSPRKNDARRSPGEKSNETSMR